MFSFYICMRVMILPLFFKENFLLMLFFFKKLLPFGSVRLRARLCKLGDLNPVEGHCTARQLSTCCFADKRDQRAPYLPMNCTTALISPSLFLCGFHKWGLVFSLAILHHFCEGRKVTIAW